MVYVTSQEREYKRRKNQTTIDDDPITVNYNVLLQMKEDKAMYLRRRQTTNYVHRVASHASSVA
jgi:hypothetical protein